MNVEVHGYATAFLRCALMAGLLLALAAALAADRHLPRVRSADAERST